VDGEVILKLILTKPVLVIYEATEPMMIFTYLQDSTLNIYLVRTIEELNSDKPEANEF
jgi:hypothetical protein